MTFLQRILLIATIVLGTMLTRFLPFIVFSSSKKPPLIIQYLGKVLPYAVIGLLVVYSVKDIHWSVTTDVIPETIAIASVILLHLWRKNMLLSICGGTIFYMFLVNIIG